MDTIEAINQESSRERRIERLLVLGIELSELHSERIERTNRRLTYIERRIKYMADLLAGIQADEATLASVVPQLVSAVETVDAKLEAALAQPQLDKAEIDSIHQSLQADIAGVQQALQEASAAGGGGSGPGPSGAPGEEGASGSAEPA